MNEEADKSTLGYIEPISGKLGFICGNTTQQTKYKKRNTKEENSKKTKSQKGSTKFEEGKFQKSNPKFQRENPAFPDI